MARARSGPLADFGCDQGVAFGAKGRHGAFFCGGRFGSSGGFAGPARWGLSVLGSYRFHFVQRGRSLRCRALLSSLLPWGCGRATRCRQCGRPPRQVRCALGPAPRTPVWSVAPERVKPFDPGRTLRARLKDGSGDVLVPPRIMDSFGSTRSWLDEGRRNMLRPGKRLSWTPGGTNGFCVGRGRTTSGKRLRTRGERPTSSAAHGNAGPKKAGTASARAELFGMVGAGARAGPLAAESRRRQAGAGDVLRTVESAGSEVR